MTKANLDHQYWNNRYLDKKTGWDIGHANTIHTEYVASHYDQSSKILIPGAGNAYEAIGLHTKGFTAVYPLDFAPEVKARFCAAHPYFPANHYILSDFFEQKGSYDLILEQTFFCAIDPSLRTRYVDHVHSLLAKGGKLYGVLFSFEKPDGPPFGGSVQEYRTLFQDKFEILKLEESTKSIAPRAGNEVIIELLKK